MYFCRRDQFNDTSGDKGLTEGMVDYWNDGASEVNRTNSSVREDSDYFRESSQVGRGSEY